MEIEDFYDEESEYDEYECEKRDFLVDVGPPPPIPFLNIWVDDLRLPPHQGYLWFKRVEDLLSVIPFIGDQIYSISLDHDLGDGVMEGIDFMKWLEDKVFMGEYSEIPIIKFHTANPIGRKNMENCYRSILRKLEI